MDPGIRFAIYLQVIILNTTHLLDNSQCPDYLKISKRISEYNHLLYCAGSNVGTWQGFEKQQLAESKQQLEVNFFSVTQFAKQWIKTNGAGTFIAVGSNSIQLENNGYRLIYDISKQAVAHAINLLRNN